MDKREVYRLSELKALEFPFIRSGFKHELLKRDGLICLVERSKPEHWHYEVIKLRIEPDKDRFGIFYPAHERYPSNEEWGTYGFTYLGTDLRGAEKRYRELIKGGLTVWEGQYSRMSEDPAQTHPSTRFCEDTP
jgi:hypothetical protein